MIPSESTATNSLAPTSARMLCPRCERPLRSCLCRWVTPTANPVALLILQHPQERRHAKGSVRLLELSLSNCQVETGDSFEPVRLRSWLTAPGPDGGAPTSLLLYPPDAVAGPEADSPAATRTPPMPGGRRLVLLDGSWRQTRRMLREHPALRLLPRCPLPEPPPSRYSIRKAQRPEQRSTLEAACLALGMLEGRSARYEPLLSAFDGWVAQMRMEPPTPAR